MAAAHLVCGLIFMYGLDAWLPAVIFFCVGALWSAYAYDQLTLEIEREEE
jgi:hypothetical protein